MERQKKVNSIPFASFSFEVDRELQLIFYFIFFANFLIKLHDDREKKNEEKLRNKKNTLKKYLKLIL